MKQDQERWLDEKIKQDLIRWADEEERLLMEDEELKDVHMPADSLEKIHQRLAAEAANKETDRETSEFFGEKSGDTSGGMENAPGKAGKGSGRVRIKALLVLAAALVAVIGVGVVSSGKKLFSPDIRQEERGAELQTKVENTDSTYSEQDEEIICQEIQEELGVLPIRFIYRPDGMYLKKYYLDVNNAAFMIYSCNGTNIHVIICKDYSESIIDWQTDGKPVDSLGTVKIEPCGLDVEVYVYENTDGSRYYNVGFEYLDTYYDITTGILAEEEFIKLIENIVIKNV